jgi:hypothetical protein
MVQRKSFSQCGCSEQKCGAFPQDQRSPVEYSMGTKGLETYNNDAITREATQFLVRAIFMFGKMSLGMWILKAMRGSVRISIEEYKLL